MFVWRVCVGILPHRAELFHRHLVDNPFCARCRVAVETIVHALMECRGLSEVWRAKPFSLPQVDTFDSMWVVFQALKRTLTPDHFLASLVMCMCWKLWEWRNLETHGEQRDFPSDVVTWSTDFLAAYRSAQAPNPAVHCPVSGINWKPPKEDQN